MSRSQIYKPKESAPRSDQYEIVDQRGRRTGVERTIVKDKTLPPTPKQGQGYKLVGKTKH